MCGNHYEFENIPASYVTVSENRTVVPLITSLTILRTGNIEKNFIRAQGIATVRCQHYTPRMTLPFQRQKLASGYF